MSAIAEWDNSTSISDQDNPNNAFLMHITPKKSSTNHICIERDSCEPNYRHRNRHENAEERLQISKHSIHATPRDAYTLYGKRMEPFPVELLIDSSHKMCISHFDCQRNVYGQAESVHCTLALPNH